MVSADRQTWTRDRGPEARRAGELAAADLDVISAVVHNHHGRPGLVSQPGKPAGKRLGKCAAMLPAYGASHGDDLVRPLRLPRLHGSVRPRAVGAGRGKAGRRAGRSVPSASRCCPRI